MKTELTIDELHELYDLADAYADQFDHDADVWEQFCELRDKLGQMAKELKGESK